jgi:HlyD family secretion protein
MYKISNALRSRRWIWLTALAVVVVGAGLIYYQKGYLPAQAQSQGDELQTSIARTGDLVIYASGTGTLESGHQFALGFGTSGEIAELNVQPGDTVSAGDVLAVQGDVEVLKAQVESDRLALMEAKEALRQVEANAGLARAQAALSVADAEDNLQEAERTRRNNQEGNRASSTTIKAAEAEVAVAKSTMDQAKKRYDDLSGRDSDDPARAQAYKNYAAAVQRYQSALINLNWYTGKPTELQQAQYDAEVAIAQAELDDANRTYEQLQDGPDPIELQKAQVAVAQAQVALSTSETNLDKANLVAPIGGTILSVDAEQGDTVAGTFITMADLSELFVSFNVDESEMDLVDPGNEIEAVFDALPDTTYGGQVTQVDPVLSSVGNAATVHGEAGLEPPEGGDFGDLMIGMHASVNVISARAMGAVLVPVEAVRDLGDDQYAVFVMEGGQPVLHPVTVGLQDVTFAEITSGVQAGDEVTTGTVQTQ